MSILLCTKEHALRSHFLVSPSLSSSFQHPFLSRVTLFKTHLLMPKIETTLTERVS